MGIVVIAIAIVIAITLLICIYTTVQQSTEGFRRRGYRGGYRRGGYHRGPAFIPVGTYTNPVYVSDVPVIGENCILREDLNDPFGRRGIYKYYCS